MGLVLGFLAPVLGMVLVWVKGFRVLAFKEFLQYMLLQPGKGLLTSVLTLSLLANAILFTIYVNRKLDKTARGLFAATCIYAILILLGKLWPNLFI